MSIYVGSNMSTCRKRRGTYFIMLCLPFIILAFMVIGYFFTDVARQTNFSQINLPPSSLHFFGTDQMGRDMFFRSMAGISLSISIGLLTAFISAFIALLLGSLSVLGGKYCDDFITWLIDLFLGIPHILLLILISFALGKGFLGLVLGIGLSHWMLLSRIIRAEILSVKDSIYVRTATKLGLSKFKVFVKHIIPAVFPQFLVGTVLLFPHAILHEAAVTFLGFGLPPEQPAIGIILSDSMKYLSTGQWWLTLFPGLLLIFSVLIFDYMGHKIKEHYKSQSIYS